jgi:alanyl-tRNA synthetase
VAMKVIVDHSRSAAFLVGDGVLPSNEGRGYVLRRILRRAIRYGRQLGLHQPFLHETASVVFEQMKAAYPELTDGAAFITNVIKNEELRFSETLDNGLKLLSDRLEELKAKGETTIPGEFVFKLYDTYGFPIDIVQDVIRDEKIEIDREGFDRSMAVQRTQSRSVTSFTGLNEAYKKLASAGFKSEFLGYQETTLNSEVMLLVQDGKEVDEASPETTIEVITKSTPFYGESGGQVGDRGIITDVKGGEMLEVLVEDTIKDPTGIIVHKGRLTKGHLKKGDEVQLIVNSSKRFATAQNHTATHILHAALRSIVGDHVKQAGSMVAPDRLRFDFNHFSQVDSDQLDKIELYVNERVRANVPVDKEEMHVDQALESGATALFEEKYGETVRVISLSDFSKELCGGTHVGRTGDIGLFKIVSEASVASGVRRIEALTGEAALSYIQKTIRQLQDTAKMLKVKPDDVALRVEKTLVQQKAQEKEITQLKSKLASQSTASTTSTDIKTINGVSVLAQKVDTEDPAALRDLADQLKEKMKSGIVVLGSAAGPKAMLVATISKDLVGKYHAGKIIKEVAALVGGGGGGRPDMAQAGGSKPENMDHAIKNVCGIVEKF